MRMHRVEKFARFSPSANVLKICAAFHVPGVTYRVRDPIVMGNFFRAHVSIRLVSRSRHDEHR